MITRVKIMKLSFVRVPQSGDVPEHLSVESEYSLLDERGNHTGAVGKHSIMPPTAVGRVQDAVTIIEEQLHRMLLSGEPTYRESTKSGGSLQLIKRGEQ